MIGLLVLAVLLVGSAAAVLIALARREEILPAPGGREAGPSVRGGTHRPAPLRAQLVKLPR